MNTTTAIVVFATFALVGSAPFVAVYRGSKVDDSDERDLSDNDDTTQLPRVTDEPYNY